MNCHISLTNYVEYLFQSLFAMHLSPVVKCLFRYFVHLFSIGLLVFLFLFWVPHKFWKQIPYQVCNLQIFFSHSVICLLFFNSIFWRWKFLTLTQIYQNFLFMDVTFGIWLWPCRIPFNSCKHSHLHLKIFCIFYPAFLCICSTGVL